ncbi:zona pellucida sperm-binding protein 3 [Ctenodactylus gundi]
MEPSGGLLVCLVLWGSAKLCCPQPLQLSWQGRPHPPDPAVEVQCLEAQLVVVVHRDLFGTGKLVRPSDLTLGPEGCKPLVSKDTDGPVKFEVGLHQCGSSVQVTDDALVYSTFLLHEPRPVGNLSIVRTNRAKVPIECRYPRHGNVSSRAILPTWVPFRTTVSAEERLAFSLRLMEQSWSAEKLSPTFYLGEAAHLQAEVRTGSHLPLQLYVDHCVATPTPDQNASPHHTIVDFHGCLVDGLAGGLSAFHAPRPGPGTLRFTVDMFHFANDSRNMIYITCHLKVTPAHQVPDQLHKACSFNKSSNSWSPIEGAADICKCCDKGDCDMLPAAAGQGPRSASRSRRHVIEEADVTLGPLIFLGEAADRSTARWASPAHTSVALGLGLAAIGVLTLAAAFLALTRKWHTAPHSVSLSE